MKKERWEFLEKIIYRPIIRDYSKRFRIPCENSVNPISHDLYDERKKEYKNKIFSIKNTYSKREDLIDRHKVCAILTACILEKPPFDISKVGKKPLLRTINERYSITCSTCLIKIFLCEEYKKKSKPADIISHIQKRKWIYPTPTLATDATYVNSFIKDLYNFRYYSKKNQFLHLVPLLGHIYFHLENFFMDKIEREMKIA